MYICVVVDQLISLELQFQYCDGIHTRFNDILGPDGNNIEYSQRH